MEKEKEKELDKEIIEENQINFDDRRPGAHPIPQGDEGEAGDIGATGKLQELLGTLTGTDPEVTGSATLSPLSDEDEEEE